MHSHILWHIVKAVWKSNVSASLVDFDEIWKVVRMEELKFVRMRY